MEKRFKTLYIITIIAILGFIGMQVYWLYCQYEYSMTQYEDVAETRILEKLDSYRKERLALLDSTGAPFVNPSIYTISKIRSAGNSGYTVTTTRLSEPGYAHKMLGLKENRKLTESELLRAADIIQMNLSLEDSLKAEATVNNPPSESAIFDALKNYELEKLESFSISKIDSMLLSDGIKAKSSIFTTDSIEWLPELHRHNSVFNPVMQISVPISEIDKKNVRITVDIPLSQVISDMAGTLTMVALVSLLLIACLIYQITTIFRLNKLDKLRTEFTSTMIHELKRPVSTLKMCVSGFSNDKMNGDAEIRTQLLSQSRKALDLLAAYFSKMRDLTFNKAQEIPLNCEKLSLRQILDESNGRVPKPSDKNVEFDNRIPDDMEIFADRTHLTNIFTNLIENAVKYSGQNVKIIADAAVSDSGALSVSLSDDGNGIPKSDIRRIFTRFYRGHSMAERVSGLGLGLAYVKMLVEAHGGNISVKSRTSGHDKGTRFTIEFMQ